MRIEKDRPFPYIMGVINSTDDSFYAASRVDGTEQALSAARLMIEGGADIIDIGGESTRPGAEPVDEGIELKRTAPLIRRLNAEFPEQLISCDTYKSAVAAAALDAGAAIINDISGFAFSDGLLGLLAERKPYYVLMHIQGRPSNMQKEPHYDDLIGELTSYFEGKIELLDKAGFPLERIILDPGIGFGKRLEHNLELVKSSGYFKGRFGLPVLIGASRKRMIEDQLKSRGGASSDRLYGSLAVHSAAVIYGADIIRTHDVRQSYEALSLAAEFKLRTPC